MAGDVSNKLLAILVGVAVVVSVIGLFIGAPGGITGLAPGANQTGYATANVQANVELDVRDNSIFLGNLRPLDTNSSESYAAKDNFTINNSGRTVVDVRYWGNESIWTYDCGGTQTLNQSNVSNNCYQMRLISNGTGAAANNSYENYQNVKIGYGNITAILRDLPSASVFTIGINVTVPKYQPSGSARNVSLTFEAMES
jgi:hypothetical protein